MNGIYASKGLLRQHIEDIKELEEACRKNEELHMKLNWDMLVVRPNHEINDFLYYEDSRLTGFLGLYAFGERPAEIEVTGMVRPEYRRRGIFKKLFHCARQECESRGAKTLLLITERGSCSGQSYVLSTGARYSFSEYRMTFRETNVPGFSVSGLTIRAAGPADGARIMELDEVCFGRSHEETDSPNVDEKYIYLAEFEGETIGKIGTSAEGEAGYLFGFCVRPGYRGRGFGRSLLSGIMTKLIREGYKTLLLEVEAENENALKLYESCGFKKTTTYDYYTYALNEARS